MENNALCADDNGKFCPEFRAVKNDEILFFILTRNSNDGTDNESRRWRDNGGLTTVSR